MVDHVFIYVDIERCLGCLSCYLACATEHSLTKSILTAPLETPRPVPRIRVVHAMGYDVPVRCMHCEKPPCVEVCPTEALVKTPEGPVLLKKEQCIGCKGCVLACPYGAITLDPAEKVVTKCDFCIDRVRRGLQPACVEACPTRALKFGTLESLMREIHEEKARELVTGLVPKGGMVLYSTRAG